VPSAATGGTPTKTTCKCLGGRVVGDDVHRSRPGR
jgi:hypothetical protein